MQETWVRSLGCEDSLERGMATPPQYFCLENSMDRGTLWATVHGVAKSQTLLSDQHFHFLIFRLAYYYSACHMLRVSYLCSLLSRHSKETASPLNSRTTKTWLSVGQGTLIWIN